MKSHRTGIAIVASLALHFFAVGFALSLSPNAEQAKPATIFVGLEAPPKGTGGEPQKKGSAPTEAPKRSQRSAEAKKPLPALVRKEPVAKRTERQMTRTPEAEKQQVNPPEAVQPSAAPGPAEPGNDTRGQGHREGSRKELNLYSAEDPLWSEYLDDVVQRIKKRFRYPPDEISRGKSGALEIRFGIRRDGILEFVEIRQTSGSDVLDGNAVQAIRDAAPFPPLPQRNIPGINLEADFRYILRSATK